MSYIGKPFLNVPVNTFAKEDFVGSDTGTNNSIANSLVLSREIPGLNASNVEVFVNNIRPVSYTHLTLPTMELV